MSFIRLSDTKKAQEWILQFKTIEDQNIARSLLNSLKYVSNREFEDALTISLLNLQQDLNARLAVYPIVSALPQGVQGYDLFNGAFLNPDTENHTQKQKRHEGRRTNFGSEDRVGHLLEKISSSQRGNGSCSKIECVPTIKTLLSQKIEHVVLVDDICGSGKRIVDFYQKILPKNLKRMISLSEAKLWIVLYAANSQGIKFIKRKLKYFNKFSDRVIIAFPEIDTDSIISDDIKGLCLRYSKVVYGDSNSALGYKGSIGGLIFEHGCPNNLPEILWRNEKRWSPLFKNRFVSPELKPSFSESSTAELGEVLWEVGQNHMALSLYELIETKKLSANDHLLITILGLILRGVSSLNIPSKLLIENSRYELLVDQGVEAELIVRGNHSLKITSLGRSLVAKFKEQKKPVSQQIYLDARKEYYYPSQCDRHTQYSGRLSSESKEDSTGQ